MAYKLIVSLQAEIDAAEGMEYYDQIDSKLSGKFLQEIDSVFDNIIVHPQFYSFVHSKSKNNIRDVKLPSFPYVVVFEIRGDSVFVSAIRNTYKNR